MAHGNLELLYEPHEKQSLFHLSPKKYRLFVGGKGSGKTTAGAAEVIRYAWAYPNNLILVGRATYKELTDTTEKEVLNFPVRFNGVESSFKSSGAVQSFNKQEHRLILTNGSEVVFRALDDEEKIKSLNLGGIWFDELTEVPEELWLAALGQLRRKLRFKMGGQWYRGSTFAIGTTNPEGHDWVWKRWVSLPDESHFYVQVTSYDNPHAGQDFVDQMVKQYPEEWVKRYVFGSFDSFSGLVYEKFQDKEPYVIAPRDIPEHWYRFIALDHGYRNPTAVLWFAVSPDGTAYVYDEFYERRMLVSEVAEVIKTKNGDQRINRMLIDPSCRNRSGATGLSIIDEFEKVGLFFEPANNDVRAGINRVKERMKDGKGLKIFQTCRNLRTELQTYKWKDLKPGAIQDAPDKPIKKDDHLVDSLRYGVSYLYDTPELKQKTKGWNWRDYLRIGKEQTDDHWMAA